MMHIDASELDAFADDLVRGSIKASRAVIATTIKAGHSITQDVRRSLEGSKHYPHLGRAMSYDVEYGPGSVTVEAGYDKDRPQGPLGNIREYGTADTPPHGDLQRAFEREVPVWQRHVERAVGDL